MARSSVGADGDAEPTARPSADETPGELEPVWHPSKDELAEIIGLPHPQPQVRLTNQAVGVADEVGRLVAAGIILLLVFVGLAVSISPWFWIGVAVFLGNVIATIVWLRRRRRQTSPLQLPAPRK